MVGVKSLPQALTSRFTDVVAPSGKATLANAEFLAALKFFLLVPLFPVAGYCLLDQTGVSQFLVEHGAIPHPILGEGFGHVGLCFSVHYVFSGLRSLVKGLALLVR